MKQRTYKKRVRAALRGMKKEAMRMWGMADRWSMMTNADTSDWDCINTIHLAAQSYRTAKRFKCFRGGRMMPWVDALAAKDFLSAYPS